MFMVIDWNFVVNGTITFVALIILKALLDLQLAQKYVKYFSWIPLRNFLRTKPIAISGTWEQVWDSAGSTNFVDVIDRHSHTEIKQAGTYCYAEFISRGVTYILFGMVKNSYFAGYWHDKNDPLGYFGACHLEIIDSNTMKGRWIGHSKLSHEVKGDVWNWKKCG